MKPDPVVILTSFVLPLLSLLALSWSYYVGATLLVGSGFLAAYALVSRSELILTIPGRAALRLIANEVFALLAAAALGGVFSILLMHEGAILSLVPSGDLSDPMLRMMTLDLEAFYLTRPLLSAIFITLALAAVVVLFREPFQSATRPLAKRLMRAKHLAAGDISMRPEPQPRRSVVRRCLPYVILVASALLGIAITTYPYTVETGGVIGSDSWFYLQQLGAMHTFADVRSRFEADRGFFLLLLFMIRTATGLDAQSLIEWMPALLAALLAVSSFVLVREGTGRPWVAAFASLLSVVSAQTSLGMGAFIITNWFALSIANFMLALLVRSIRRRSTFSAAGTLILSFVLLASYAFLWAVVIAELALVLVASILAYRNVTRLEWKREVGVVGGALVGCVLTPMAVLFLVVIPLLGFKAQGLDVSTWLTMGWNYVVEGATPKVLGSAMATLEKAFDFAGNRVDLPFLTLLSIVGVLDQGSQCRSFERILSAMILVPAVVTIITPSIYFSWRGLYIIPLYITGALGAESIIRRVNEERSPWESRGRLAFAVAFTAYIFLSHLSYSLRALELLILAARGS
jgi:hypothetical protein